MEHIAYLLAGLGVLALILGLGLILVVFPLWWLGGKLDPGTDDSGRIVAAIFFLTILVVLPLFIAYKAYEIGRAALTGGG